MELRELAIHILDTPTLDARFFFPEGGLATLTDERPGTPRPWRSPARPPELQIASKKARKRKGMPHPDSLHDPEMRVRCLHTFANHELMALELMAWALLAYPDAPPAFRKGLAWLIQEEQLHLALYMERIEAHGACFGDLPVNDHFWRIAPLLETPLQWVCAMNLSFEQANLDHAPLFARHFERVGDSESAALMERIVEDEIKHVGFGVRWLKHFSDGDIEDFDVFLSNLNDYMGPERARGGEELNRAARRRAGLSEEFIERLAAI